VELDGILNDVSAYLEWELDEGRRTVSVSPDVVAELGDAAGKVETEMPEPKPKPQAPPTPAVSSSTPRTPAKPGDSLEAVAAEIAECTACELHEARTNTVPGQGCMHPDILFIGEAPGADEDAQGIPFVGRSGQLLTKMIEAMGYSRDTVFIANINKCRPPGNRAPSPAEMQVCIPYLKRQISLLEPKLIVALGATAINGLVDLPKGMGITKVRGSWLEFEGIPLMPTFHPAYMLRNPNMKRPVWEDLKNVLRRLGKPIPEMKKA
jgi:uracil-DNA glycosylase